MQVRLVPGQSSGSRAINPDQGSKRRLTGWWTLLNLLAMCTVLAGSALGAPRESLRKQITKLVVQIQRADYEGNQAALGRLYQDLAPFADDKELGARVRYWRGFAQWRRAMNGFNDSVAPSELQEDLKQAISEFEEAIRKDPAFADAKAAAGSSMGILMYLYRQNPALATTEFKEPERVREFLMKALSYQKEAEAAEPENPRVLWVLGQTRWVLPAERGGGQDKAFETYQKGLKAVRERKGTARDPLMPSWGEPELLMNLAWSNLNRSTPDVAAAEQYARSALALVPYWHYVKDILLPQVLAAKAKQSTGRWASSVQSIMLRFQAWALNGGHWQLPCHSNLTIWERSRSTHRRGFAQPSMLVRVLSNSSRARSRLTS